MNDQLDILAQIDAFCARHGMAESRFGRAALSDPSFVYRLRRGGDIKRRTILRVLAWMSSYEADGKPRPRRAGGSAERVAA